MNKTYQVKAFNLYIKKKKTPPNTHLLYFMQTDAKILHSIKNKHLWITSIAISDSIAFEDFSQFLRQS